MEVGMEMEMWDGDGGGDGKKEDNVLMMSHTRR